MNETAGHDINPDEFSVAEKEAETGESVYTHKFKTPYDYQGKPYSELTFNWGKLTGRDGLAIENEMQQLGKALVAPVFSGEYLVRMASRACTEPLGADAFDGMPLFDYNKIRSAARSFLLQSEL
jgi:hypothetical protein